MAQFDQDESVINLRDDLSEVIIEEENISSTDNSKEALPSSKVKIKFDKFVNLVITHAYDDIVDKYMDEDVVISTDLLADLANSHEDDSDRKLPIMFLMGIVLGIVVTWFLVKY